MPGNVSSVLRSLRTRVTNLTESTGEFLSSFGSTASSSEQASQREAMTRMAAEQLAILKRQKMADQPIPTPISPAKRAAERHYSAERVRSAVESYILRPTSANLNAVVGLAYEYRDVWTEMHADD